MKYEFGDIVRDEYDDMIFVTIGYDDGCFEGVVIKSDMYRFGATEKFRDKEALKRIVKIGKSKTLFESILCTKEIL